MAFIYEHEWIFFASSEISIWIFMVLFALARYRFGLDGASRILLMIIIALNLFQGALVAIDYSYTGKVSFFQTVIVVVFLYACTLGKADFLRIDLYIKHKMTPASGSGLEKLESYMGYRRNLMLLHASAFVLLHFAWYAFDHGTLSMPVSLLYFHEWIDLPHEGFYRHPVMNAISYFWKVIFYFDLVVFAVLRGLWQLGKPQGR